MGDINQDDIDALLAGAFGGEDNADTEAEESPPPPPPADNGIEGVASQDDIDALFASIGGAPEPEGAPPPAPDPVAAPPPPPPPVAAPPPPPPPPAPVAAPPPPPPPPPAPVAAPPPPPAPVAAPPPPPPPPAPVAAPPPPPAPVASPVPPPVMAPPPVYIQSQALASPLTLPPDPVVLRDGMTVMTSAGEVESLASQISGTLGQLSEKAHRYMQAWLAADSETKDLRSRLLQEEHLNAVARGEKDALNKEVEFLRGKMGSLEGEKLGVEESRRSSESSLQFQIRELESQVSLLSAEIDSLKGELSRVRTEATGADIESRRARFEADRLKSEVESERMERLRIQRALENREKEMQALQAQSSGQASSLFIDELHRLVRRLESELDARVSGAHAALRQLDRLEVAENMVPVVSNLRAGLLQAIGSGADDTDALKSLGREAERVAGPQGIAPGKTEILSFETAISTYHLSDALDVAGALLREAKTSPAALMRRVYQCPALRRPEMAEHLTDLSRLLEGLRTVQEASDRTRGTESAESEIFYVQLFDFLHNLVRLKLVNRMTGEMWGLFLDLRGRFSFVTSDKQWSDYRDGVLGDKQKA